jgi:hypothetical protein
MTLLRHARPCAGHPRLRSVSAPKGVDGRDEPGHDEAGALNQPANDLNRNRSFFSLPQAYEKSSFFRLLVQMNRCWKPMNLNQKVKP